MRGLVAIVVLVLHQYDYHHGAGAARREVRAVTAALTMAALLALAVAAMFEDLGG